MKKGDFSLKIKVDFKNAFPKRDDLNGEFDLLVNGFNGCEKIKYSKELNGQSTTLKQLCNLSNKCKKPIVSAFETDNYGTQKRSAGVFENGKLLGISDATAVIDNCDFLPSSTCKLYDLDVGKIGVAVQDDLYCFNLFKSLAICGSEIIICLTNFTKKEINSILIRAYSFLLGVPIVLTFDGGCLVSNTNGFLLEESQIYEVLPNFEFTLKTTKTRLFK